ncbi:MAG: SGNH/GDSL hydrolase family protein, partial [Microcoleaceae cyanobacterium]
KKPADTIRIAVLGDSFTSAVQVNLEKTYAEVIEKELNNKCAYLADKKIEVINFGVNGYGTAQQLFTLQQEVWDYDPDVVVLGFYIGNDLMNNSMQLADNLYSPFFVYDKNGNLGIDMSFTEKSLTDANRYFSVNIDHLPAWLINNLRLLQLVRQVEVNQEKKRLIDFSANLEANIYRQPKTPEWQEAWDITEQLLTFFANDVKLQGKKFLLFTIASANQVIPDPNIRKAYMESHQINNLFYPEQRIKALGDRQGFRVFNLGEPFQKYAQANNICLHGFQGTCGGHWNEQGHKLGGKMLADKLCKKYLKKLSAVN